MSNEIPKLLGIGALAVLTLTGCAEGSNPVEHQPITQRDLQRQVNVDIAMGLQTLNPAKFRPQELEGFRLITTATDAEILSNRGILRLADDYPLSNGGAVYTIKDYELKGNRPQLVHDTIAYKDGLSGEGPLNEVVEEGPDGSATIDPRNLDRAFRVVFPNTPFLNIDVGPIGSDPVGCIGGYSKVDGIRYFVEACPNGFFQVGREFPRQ